MMENDDGNDDVDGDVDDGGGSGSDGDADSDDDCGDEKALVMRAVMALTMEVIIFNGHLSNTCLAVLHSVPWSPSCP